MVRLAQKAFAPGRIPFPLLHVDTGYKFREMYEFRDRFCREIGAELDVYRNEEAIAGGANPFDLGTQRCCGLLKTQALLAGAAARQLRRRVRRRPPRRGEVARQGAGLLVPRPLRPVGSQEPAPRAVEPVQRPPRAGREHPRVPAVELDRARRLALHLPGGHPDRADVLRARARGGGARRAAHPARGRTTARLHPGEKAERVMCRFRTLGCIPCTGAVRSDARHAWRRSSRS